MATALMNWEAGRSRWRKKYKGVWIQKSAADLGGTNYNDSVVAANQYFRQEQARIDRETAVKTYRPYEQEHLAIQENIQTEMKTLVAVLRANPTLQTTLMPVLEDLKHRETLIKQELRKPTLSPLDDRLRNPLHISPERVEGEAFTEATQQIASQIREQSTIRVPREEWHELEGYIPANHPYLGIDDSVYQDYDDNSEYYKRMNLITGHNSNLADRVLEDRIQSEAGRVAGLKDELLAGKKKDFGLIVSEYVRGQVNQMLKEAGIDVPESRKLEYHIDKFIEARTKDCKLGEIKPGRLKKVIDSIGIYKKWSPIINGNVEKIGTKEHIEAYHSFLAQRLSNEGIKPGYANDLFSEFKALINWLVSEEVLTEFPRCLQLKSKRFRFTVIRQKPKTVPLEVVHRILEGANDRQKLFILLILNCGFGASEIGQLEKDEYNPATGRITHRRYKTEKSDNVPTVCYELWKETKELLDQTIAGQKKYPKHSPSAKLLLVNENGLPLWSESIDKGRIDNITCSFKRLIARLRKSDPEFPAISFYMFRKTVSSLIGNKPEFMGLAWLWLGHAPKTMAGESYIAHDKTILDKCLLWLHGQIFGAESSLETRKMLT